MINKHSLSNQNIINCLKTHYNINVAHLNVLSLGADKNASVYKAQACNKRSYFVKVKRGKSVSVGVVVARLLHEVGIQQIIPSFKTTQNQNIQALGAFTIIVYPFIEGQDGFSHILTPYQWEVLGRALKAIHTVEIPLALQKQIRKERYASVWRDAVKKLFILIKERVSGDQIAVKLRDFMKENKEVIQTLVDRAESLSQNLKGRASQSVLCHSDIHGGNVLIDRNNALYIIDWDDPIMAPKERDLMFIGGGVGNVWNKSEEGDYFYKGYGITEIDADLLAYYRHERIVEDIALFGQELLFETGGNRQLMYQQLLDMFQPGGVVEIALKTGKNFQR